ncbi:MAG: [protein-PII] uridylyltransferase, partial [Cypionkella sp.]|nr:[protein-PII] uridylyltransferase [Cypionkella sp.]
MLIPPQQIIDPDACIAAIAAEAAEAPDARAIRSIAVRHLGEARSRGNAALAEAFEARPLEARALVRGQAWLTDGLVRAALQVACQWLHPLPNPTESERIAALAVGGYGRAEMAPASDVDLLFLTPWKTTPWAESVVESMLYILWDLKLKVGHATRTVKDCLRLGREDITIRTALLEHRFIAGHEPLAAELGDRLWSDLFRNTGPEFIEAKLAERAERHKRQGGQRYVLEPNVK